MDFHTYENKEITFVISNDIMMYARGKTYTIKHWLKGAPDIWAYVIRSMLEWCFDNQWPKNVMSTINFKQ